MIPVMAAIQLTLSLFVTTNLGCRALIVRLQRFCVLTNSYIQIAIKGVQHMNESSALSALNHHRH